MAGIPFSDLALDHAESLTAMLHCKADFAWAHSKPLFHPGSLRLCRRRALHRMYSATRRRETLYGAYILQHHPEYAGTPFYHTPDSPYSLEGGDVMNLSESVLAVGISQRTMPEAIEQRHERNSAVRNPRSDYPGHEHPQQAGLYAPGYGDDPGGCDSSWSIPPFSPPFESSRSPRAKAASSPPGSWTWIWPTLWLITSIWTRSP